MSDLSLKEVLVDGAVTEIEQNAPAAEDPVLRGHQGGGEAGRP